MPRGGAMEDFTYAGDAAVLPEAEIRVADDEHLGKPHTPMDNGRLTLDLGFAPRFDLVSGLADYVARIRAADRYAAGAPR